MTAYYNEIDPFAAEWLRQLISAGHIAPGVVDTRSIIDVRPSDLVGFSQCHFFAGVGVWSYALRRSGWSDARPVWTGSCPCQSFSAAGKRDGFNDERHLWPAFYWLIKQCKPPIIFGEQVAGNDADAWIDLVQADMEALEYAFGAIPFPAAGVGTPCIRDRSYWMGSSSSGGCEWEREEPAHSIPLQAGSDASAPWRNVDWVECSDGRTRPFEPGTFPLAHGSPARVGRLRGYGNAINAEAATAFIEAYISRNEVIFDAATVAKTSTVAPRQGDLFGGAAE